MKINDEIIFFDEVVDWPTKSQIEEIKKINKKYMSKHNKQEWLKQEVEKLGFELEVKYEKYTFRIKSKFTDAKILLSYDIDYDKITYIIHGTFIGNSLKKLIEIAEQYKEM